MNRVEKTLQLLRTALQQRMTASVSISSALLYRQETTTHGNLYLWYSVICPTGYEEGGMSETCQICAVGTYRTQGVHTDCQSCPLYYTTANTGSADETDCSICKPSNALMTARLWRGLIQLPTRSALPAWNGGYW